MSVFVHDTRLASMRPDRPDVAALVNEARVARSLLRYLAPDVEDVAMLAGEDREYLAFLCPDLFDMTEATS